MPAQHHRASGSIRTGALTALAVITTSWAVTLPAQDTAPRLAPAAATVSESYPVPADGVFQVLGHGWGHGHGMSQVGAIGAAQQGLTGEQILGFYYPGTTRTVVPSRPIKVQLTGDTDNDVQVAETKDLTATDRATGATQKLTPNPGDTATRWGVLRNSAGLHALYLSALTKTWTDTPAGLAGHHGVVGPVVLSSAGGSVSVYEGTSGSARTYPGVAVGSAVGAGLQTTVEVPMEDYVRGVVVSEILGAPLQAARAQAVAARTYGAWREANPRSATVDVRDDTWDQVYVGASYTSTADQAVSSTANQVLLYGGVPAFAQFGASDGGWTVSGGAAYLPAQRDDYDYLSGSVSHSWTASLPASAVQAAFPAVGTLTSIEITQRDGNGDWGGRVLQVVLHGQSSTGAATSVSTTGEGLYGAYSWPAQPQGLRHYWFTFVNVPPSVPQSVTATPQDGQVTVSWQPPAQQGSSTVSSYLISADPGPQGAVVDGSSRSAVLTGLKDGTTYRFRVTARSASGASSAVVTPTVTPSFTWTDFVPLAPTRVFDSRNLTSQAGATGKFGPGETRTLTLAGNGLVPADATAVAVTITATQGSASSYLTVFPYAYPRPTASMVNWTRNADRASTVIARLGSGGRLNLYNSAGTVHMIVDVVGYWRTASGARLQAVTPVRTLDTRLSASPLGPTGQILAHLAAPTTAAAALVNLTAVNPSTRTFFAGFPAGVSWPGTSTLNADQGDTRAAATLIKIGQVRDIAVYNSAGRADALVDTLGWFTPSVGGTQGQVAAVSPVRLLDTRLTGGPVPGGGSRTIQITGQPGLPSSGISAVLVSLTAVDAQGATFVRADDGSAGQVHSSLNVSGPQPTANLALVPLSADGTIRLYVDAAQANLLLDVYGVVRS